LGIKEKDENKDLKGKDEKQEFLEKAKQPTTATESVAKRLEGIMKSRKPALDFAAELDQLATHHGEAFFE